MWVLSLRVKNAKKYFTLLDTSRVSSKKRKVAHLADAHPCSAPPIDMNLKTKVIKYNSPG